MSTLSVNTIQSSSGSTILIPSGNSLSLAGTVINSGTLPPSPVGNTNQYIYTNGTSLSFNVAGPKSIQTFNSSGTWNRPTGIGKIWVMLVGGGGAASGHMESGGAGGYAERLIDVSSVTSVQVTIGDGSTSWTYYAGAAGGGGTSSFGSYITCTGGRGANTSHQHCGGLPGVGSGGDLNTYGGGGTGHMAWACGKGGSSYFGGAGATGHPQGGSFTHNFDSHSAPGCGGTGGYEGITSWSPNPLPGRGRNGICIVYEYA